MAGMILDKPIGVAGAGSIGCFVGGMYAAAGRRVALLARPRLIEEIEANGLRLTSFKGFEKRIAADQLTLSEDPSILGNTGAVLVTVKSADTAGIADIIAQHAPAGGNGAVQCDRARRGTISSRHLGRYRHRAGRGRHRKSAFGAGPEDAPE